MDKYKFLSTHLKEKTNPVPSTNTKRCRRTKQISGGSLYISDQTDVKYGE